MFQACATTVGNPALPPFYPRLHNVHLMSQPVEQLKLHAFGGLGAGQDLPHDVRTRLGIMIVDRLSRPSHVGEDSLTEMPAEERVRRTERIVEKTSVERLSSNLEYVALKKDNLIPILRVLSKCKIG